MSKTGLSSPTGNEDQIPLGNPNKENEVSDGKAIQVNLGHVILENRQAHVVDYYGSILAI